MSVDLASNNLLVSKGLVPRSDCSLTSVVRGRRLPSVWDWLPGSATTKGPISNRIASSSNMVVLPPPGGASTGRFCTYCVSPYIGPVFHHVTTCRFTSPCQGLYRTRAPEPSVVWCRQRYQRASPPCFPILRLPLLCRSLSPWCSTVGLRRVLVHFPGSVVLFEGSTQDDKTVASRTRHAE